LLLIWLTSCGGSDSPVVMQCVAQCEAASDCPQGTGDCEDTCVNELEEAQRIACELEYEAILDCTDTASDVCSTSECATRISAYTTCLGEFCGTSPGDPGCP